MPVADFPGEWYHKFHVVYADPPWPSSKRKGTGSWMDRAAHAPYLTMTEKQLIELPISFIAAEAAFLVLWSTWMHLDLAMRCIRAWEFDYCSGMPWLKLTKNGKIRYGTGIWFMGCTEPILVAKRGNTRELLGLPPGQSGNPRPARPGIVMAENVGHSRKPDEVAEWIEKKMPGPYVELFARNRREGWESWGNELQ